MQTTQTQTTNGVDVARLVETIEQVKANPAIARFNFRVSNQWQDGGHNRSVVKDFYGATQNIPHAVTFKMDSDEPAILLGEDRGANPVEYLLHALAACVTTSMVYHAAARGIEIQEVESTIDGDIDLHGFLDLDPAVRNGFQAIRMSFRIKANAPDNDVEQLVQLGRRFSPVFDTLTKGVPVMISASRM